MKPRIFMLTAVLAVTAAPAAAQEEFDQHFLDSTEYFVSRDSLRGTISWVAVARQLLGPTAEMGGEAQFMVTIGAPGIQAGQTIWTRHFWKTRHATMGEAVIGQRVFCSNRMMGERVYRAPSSRDEALGSGWWTGIITDVSDAARGEVRVGSYRAHISCLRVEDLAPPVRIVLGLP